MHEIQGNFAFLHSAIAVRGLLSRDTDPTYCLYCLPWFHI